MILDQWMSDFYGISWYRIDNSVDISHIKDRALLEWRIASNDFDSLILAQKNNFLLVESFIEFTTEVFPESFDSTNIRFVVESDVETILYINQESMCMNPNYKTRLNNPIFFDEGACSRYYTSAVSNHIRSEDVLTCVCEIDTEVVGFFMLKMIDEHTYKGLMTGVIPKARGQKLHIKMQQFLINHIGHPITLINTTQLSNMAVIKNHIRSKRNLSKIEHIFYKKVGF